MRCGGRRTLHVKGYSRQRRLRLKVKGEARVGVMIEEMEILNMAHFFLSELHFFSY